MNSLRQAFGFLTILPFGSNQAPQPGDTGRAAVWFPLVGLVIGCMVAGGGWIFSLFLPLNLSAVFILVVWVLMTGGLHLDGVADCCDGLLNSASPEHRLEIMTDSRLGSFGGIGLILTLLLKLSALSAIKPDVFAYAIILATVVSRWLVVAGGRQPLAKPGGMAADLSLGLTTRTILISTILPVLLVVLGGWRGMVAAALAILAAFGISRFARSRIGGITGDVFGLTIEMSEIMVLLTYAAL
jgi:adenosylcobinamide-GDP ribazoletransferase